MSDTIQRPARRPEHRINWGRLYPGRSYKADCTCGWSWTGPREQTRAAIHDHEEHQENATKPEVNVRHNVR